METKKLTAKDLMIGDWVNIYHFTNDEQQVKDLFHAKVVSILQGNEKENYNTIECVYGTDIAFRPADTCLPIPLTAEVLEKNGWTKPASSRVWSRNNVPSFVLEEIDDGSFEVTTDTCLEWGGLCVICFVHELQHALRLCGINDKEIVL